jgi:spermidine synthase
MSGNGLFGANPKVVHSVSSPLSGKINVWEKDGGLVLEVGGYPQSVSVNTPDLPQRYWYKAVEEVSSRLTVHLDRVLVIGVGGGTILHLLSRKFPETKIVGVEIDEAIIKIARQFFDLDKIPNLEIITGDGGEYVASYQGEPFDLVFVDAYLGGNFPLHFEEEQFLLHLRRIANPNGLLVINRAGGFSHSQFKAILGQVFAKVEVVKIPLPGFLGGMGGNFLFICS